MTTNKDVREHAEDLKAELWGSYLLFVKTFFPLVTGRPFVISNPTGRESHFITIAKELTKVARMETNSLLINVAPGSGKSVLLSMWVAWTLSKYPNSQYLYISYGHELASKHTEFIRRVVQNSHYRNLFGVEVRSDSKAKDFFQTTAGGAVKAFGSAGSVTGQDAGVPNLTNFSGAVICLPYDEIVNTEDGFIKIGVIVERKLCIKVKSYNIESGAIELKQVKGWFENPGNEIVQIKTKSGTELKCTPNHKIWTKNRGWVEAQYLTFKDILLTPFTNSFSRISQYLSRLRIRYSRIINYFNFVSCNFIILNIAARFWQYSLSYMRPYFTAPDFCYGITVNRVLFPNKFRRNAFPSLPANIYNIFSCKFHSMIPAFMSNSIRNVLSSCAISKIMNHIIFTIPIQMPYIYIRRLFSIKSPAHYLMNTNRFSFIVFCQLNCIISLTRTMRNPWFKNFSLKKNLLTRIIFSYYSVFASYFSKIRNTIKSLISRNRTPFFIKYVGHANKTYCINVEDNNNFFAGTNQGILIKNCDDLIKPDESSSDTIRQRVLDNYKETILQRPRGPNVPIISIGQRLHEDDISAFMLSGNDERKWKAVVLKSIDDAGNALYPEVHTKESLLIKQEKSPYVFASQFQQDPLPAGGALFKREYFVILNEEPKIFTTFITADTAETNKSYNDGTVFSFWGLYKIEEMGIETGQIGLHWLDCIELRIEPKDLRDAFMSFYGDCLLHEVKPLIAAIEKKSTGVTLCSILQDMRGLQIREVKRTKESGSKTGRFIEMQPILASKLVSFTENAKHISLCINHMLKITANDSHRWDDICDTAYDAIKLTLIDKDPSVIGLKSDGNKKRILDAMSQDFGTRMRARGNSWRN